MLLGGNSYLPSEMDAFTFTGCAEGTKAKSIIGGIKKYTCLLMEVYEDFAINILQNI
jgi:hypothetical protein